MKTPLSMRLMRSILEHAKRPCINQISYGQIQNLSDHYTHLLTRLQVQPNDRIGILCSKKSPHQVAMMLAGWRKSAIIVPLPDTPHPGILPLVRPRVLLTPDLQITVSEEQVQTPAPSFTQTQTGDERPALILFTSGSTADPKGVVLTHKNIIRNLDMIGTLYKTSDIHCHDVSFSILPWYHCYGLVCELLFLMTRGAHINVPYHPRNPIPEMKWIRPTVLFTVPKMLERLYKSEWNALIPPSILRHFVWGDRLRMMSVGGSHCPKHIVEFFEDRYSTPIYEGYGMTELSPMVSLNSPAIYRPGSVGKPLKGVETRIDPVSKEIQVRSPSLMRGYLSSIDDQTRQIATHPLGLVDQWYPTGDKGYLDKEGFLYVTGRLKSEYKLSNGKYVNPEYIESCILESPMIEQVLVMADPETDAAGNICLVFVSESYQDQGPERIMDEIKVRCVKHMVLPYEVPIAVYMMRERFSLENGLLSLKMEPRRKEIESRFIKGELK
jgi:long-subunit acyl-CoA synthetase (AMP-forming)